MGPAVRIMPRSLPALYDAIAGSDSDVTGEYPETVQSLHDAVAGFWRAYDARRAFLEPLPTRYILAGACGPNASAGEFYTQMQLSFEAEYAEYHRNMALYRRREQDCFDAYAARTLHGASEAAARAYKREWVRMLELVSKAYNSNNCLETVAYDQPSLRAAPGSNPPPVFWLYFGITYEDSDKSGSYAGVSCDLNDTMNEFWRAYDTEPGSERRGAAYSAAMEAYRETARAAFEEYALATDGTSAALARCHRNLESRPPEHFQRHMRDYLFHQGLTEHTDKRYKKKFAALLKSMVRYLQLKKAEAFAHLRLVPDITHVIDSFREARANPSVS